MSFVARSTSALYISINSTLPSVENSYYGAGINIYGYNNLPNGVNAPTWYGSRGSMTETNLGIGTLSAFGDAYSTLNWLGSAPIRHLTGYIAIKAPYDLGKNFIISIDCLYTGYPWDYYHYLGSDAVGYGYDQGYCQWQFDHFLNPTDNSYGTNIPYRIVTKQF